MRPEGKCDPQVLLTTDIGNRGNKYLEHNKKEHYVRKKVKEIRQNVSQNLFNFEYLNSHVCAYIKLALTSSFSINGKFFNRF